MKRKGWSILLGATVLAGCFGLSGCVMLAGRAAAAYSEARAGLPEKGDLGAAQVREMSVAGQARRYLIQMPDGEGPFPIVVLLHGGTQTAEAVWKQTSLPTLARRDRFIVVAPQGVGRHWNDGRGSTMAGTPASTVDDVGFLRALIAQTVTLDRGDRNAVFIIGASNGGFMSMRYACEAAETLRAAGSVIANLPQALAQRCVPRKPLPWIAINGVQDPLMPFAGQPAAVRGGETQPALLSADASFAFWADRARCGPPRVERIGTAVEKRVRICADGVSAVQYLIHDAGHVWPGLAVARPLLALRLGGTNLEIDAGEVIWDFFRGAR